jgi:methylamine utilization protein MauE
MPFKRNLVSKHLNSRTVGYALACLLLAADALKDRQLFADSTAVRPSVLHNPILLALLIQSEFLLALWLLIGGFARLRFIVAVACFSIFAVVSGYEAMHTMQSAAVIGQAGRGPQVLRRRLQGCQHRKERS